MPVRLPFTKLSKRPIMALIILLLAFAFAASACGSDEQQGVTLQVAGARPSPTPSPTSTPTPSAVSGQGGDSAAPFELEGRLLLLKGAHFALLDLATGETRDLEGVRSSSPASMSADGLRGAFVAFPEFGLLDLVAGETRLIDNTGSNPTGVSISPDGNWLLTLTGAFTTTLKLIAADGSTTHNVTSSSQHPIRFAWTTDSALVWWWGDEDPPTLQRFDPETDTSEPVGDTPLPLVVPPPLQASPDGTRAVNVPIVITPPGATPDPDSCFDSYVEIIDGPFTTARTNWTGTTVWAEDGLVATSPRWLDDETIVFVRLGTGTCGQVTGEPDRTLLRLDLDTSGATPQPLAGPLGNADDTSDRTQQFTGQVSHLYTLSPDGRYVAWIGGGRAAGESTVNITDVATGTTQTLLRVERSDAVDLADFLENHLFRQVVWLE